MFGRWKKLSVCWLDFQARWIQIWKVRRQFMRKRIKIIAAVLVVLLLGYEAAFRVCTAEWGEVDTDANPPRVYYSADLDLPFPLLGWCFGFRTELPFGKVRLSKGSGAYVDGGHFYRRLADGSWQDFTKQLTEYQTHKSKP